MVAEISPSSRIEALESIDPCELGQLLQAQSSEIRVEVLDQCASTSTLLLERARAGEAHATAIVCERQTAGKGRRGNAWFSEPGASLTFSLLWRFGRSASTLSGLSLAVAVAVAQALESRQGAQLKLKWPNDLLFDGRKLGGILIETLPHAGGTAAVIGVGLNVKSASGLHERVGHRVADLRECGTCGTRTELLAALLARLGAVMSGFDREGFAPLREEWLARHAWQGRQVRLSGGGRLHAQGEAVGVAEDGALLLQVDGLISPYYSGELSLGLA